MHARDTIGVTIGLKSPPKVPKPSTTEVTTKVPAKCPRALVGHFWDTCQELLDIDRGRVGAIAERGTLLNERNFDHA